MNSPPHASIAVLLGQHGGSSAKPAGASQTYSASAVPLSYPSSFSWYRRALSAVRAITNQSSS
jgi:hypothetical protein